VFKEISRSTSSLAVASVCSTVHVKSILGVGHKVKDSIEDPFKYETWLRRIHDVFCVKVIGTIAALIYMY
jgi:hypothetical protein